MPDFRLRVRLNSYLPDCDLQGFNSRLSMFLFCSISIIYPPMNTASLWTAEFVLRPHRRKAQESREDVCGLLAYFCVPSIEIKT